MAKIQNDKWYAWVLIPELRILSNVQGLYYTSLYQKNMVAFDTKEEAARKIEDYRRRWSFSGVKTRVGTGKELTVELVKRRLQG